VIVADDALAYVGSANFLGSSEGLCHETGFLFVARLVDAVLRVARSLGTSCSAACPKRMASIC
jgi:phosphatidylserine/phosphatidylglycerophosphate/cardiolipin synthase-like enzyme